MTEIGSLKWIEVSVLVLAGGLLVWWQLRDVRKAQERSRQQRLAAEARDPAAPTGTEKEPGA